MNVITVSLPFVLRNDIAPPPSAKVIETSKVCIICQWGNSKRLLCLRGERKQVRCEMDQIRTTKDNNSQQLARKDLLYRMFVTLDTTHLLMSALNEEAP